MCDSLLPSKHRLHFSKLESNIYTAGQSPISVEKRHLVVVALLSHCRGSF